MLQYERKKERDKIKSQLIDKDLAWYDEAVVVASRCWCESTTEDIEMDIRLAAVFAGKLRNWMEIASRNQMNTYYYRGLLEECGKAIGKEAYTQDDGGVCEDVLCAKIPEIVKRICSK